MNSNNGYTSHLCMGKRLLGFFMPLFRYRRRALIILCLSKRKGENKILFHMGIYIKQNRLRAQNEYIEHWVFKQQIE
jgi:hypothetical protein